VLCRLQWVGSEVLTAVTMKSMVFRVVAAMYFRGSPTFQRNISPLSSGSKSKASKKPAEAGGKLRKMEVIRSSKTWGSLYTTQHYSPEDYS
jgi:hypothetical protein